jgi:hypothetical protein
MMTVQSPLKRSKINSAETSEDSRFSRGHPYNKMSNFHGSGVAVLKGHVPVASSVGGTRLTSNVDIV